MKNLHVHIQLKENVSDYNLNDTFIVEIPSGDLLVYKHPKFSKICEEFENKIKYIFSGLEILDSWKFNFEKATELYFHELFKKHIKYLVDFSDEVANDGIQNYYSNQKYGLLFEKPIKSGPDSIYRFYFYDEMKMEKLIKHLLKLENLGS